MNRQDRRRAGKRRAVGLAGVSLAAAGGLFATYLGNPRLPRAYAAVTCNQTLTFNITSEADYIEAVGIAVDGEPFDASTDAITANNHGLVNGDAISFTQQDGTISPALTLQTPYYVVNATTNTFQVSQTPGGSPVDITVGGRVWLAPFGSINASNIATPTNNCFVLNITNNFTVTQDLAGPSSRFRMNMKDSTLPVKLTVNGNNHTVTGDPNAPSATFMVFRGPDEYQSPGVTEVRISDLTVTGMHHPASAADVSTPVFNIWASPPPQDGSKIRMYLDNVHVSDNTQEKQGGWGDGAVMYLQGETHISDSTFTRNSVTRTNYAYAPIFLYEGGRNDSRSTITNSVFTDNSASAQGSAGMGGALVHLGYQDSVLTIEGSTFDGNSVSATNQTAGSSTVRGAHGGAIFTNSPLVIRESVFTNNTATGELRGTGGAVSTGVLNNGGWLNGTSVKVYDSHFSGNDLSVTSARSGTSAYGGAIGGGETTNPGHPEPAGGLSVHRTTFDDNSVVADTAGSAAGGAVGFQSLTTSRPASTVVNSTFTGNSADDSGGALFADGAPLSVDFSTIVGNTAGVAGGVFSVMDDTITNSIVNGNTGTSGAADAVSGGVLTAQNSLFTSAGAISDSGTPVETDVLFSADAQVDALAANGGPTLGATGFTQAMRTMMPRAGVLALDAGSTSVGTQPATDQRGTGFPRVESGLTTMGAVQRLGTPPTPPPPPPVFPPSAPRDVVGVPGDREVAVSWQPPASAGSFPVTDYLVTAGPGGQTCLAKAPALTCTVTGLTNGTAYTFVVKALNGAGWGPGSQASSPVTPSAQAVRSLTLFQGKRVADGRHDRIRTGGTSVGVPAGSRLTPWIRYGATGEFKQGVANIVVDDKGGFTWTREIRKDKAFHAYVAFEDLESNRVIWQRVR